jgi:hypothetical protein
MEMTNSSQSVEASTAAEQPAMWFAQDEAQVSLAGISIERRKCYYVISQLDH